MNDAVKPAVSDETLAQEFARLVAEYHGASEDDPTKPEAWNLLADFAVENGPAISAALAAQGQEAVAVKALEWDGMSAVTPFGAYTVADYRGTASSPDEAFGLYLPIPAPRGKERYVSISLAKAAAQSDYETRIRSALTAAAQPVENDIADAVLSWMVKHDLLDAGNEYHASDVLAALDDLAPAQPVGVPASPVAIWKHFPNGNNYLDVHKAWRGYNFPAAFPLYAAPQPPAEGGWRDIANAPTNEEVLLGWFDMDGDWIIETGEAAWGWSNEVANNISYHGSASHWMPLPPAPANGGEQNG